ncbi:MAG: nucleotidyltransferase family protein [Deltaproteobacteria bacterium]|nr:nucleotidyltransferase family protein [Deltaproteobacteria bacterium]
MISGIILASGFSKRMATDKLLMPIKKIPLVKRVINAAVLSDLNEIILTYKNEKILNLIDDKIKTVYNNLAYLGQSAAVKKGTNACNKKTDAYLFIVADQPFIDKITINKIINLHKKNLKNIIVPLYDSKKGNPVLFPSLFKEDLLNIKGDTGGRVIINKYKDKVKYIKIDNKQIGIDIDTEKDLNRI